MNIQYVQVQIGGFALYWQSALEYKIICFNTEKVQKVQMTINNDYWWIIIIKFCCISKVFGIWLHSDCFDISISIYLWRCLLMLVISIASITSADSAKQAGLVGCSDIYLSKLHAVAIFFKVENFCASLYMYT